MSSPRAYLSILLLAVAAMTTSVRPAHATPYRATPSPEEWRRIHAGEVLSSHRILPGSSVIEFTAIGQVKAPAENLLAFYFEPTTLRRFQSAIREHRVISSQFQRMQVRYDVGLPWPLGSRNFTLDIHSVPTEQAVEWRLLEGNVKENRGSYAVTPMTNGQSLVTYRIQADLDTWLPPFLIAWVQGGMLPKVILEARQELETM